MIRNILFFNIALEIIVSLKTFKANIDFQFRTIDRVIFFEDWQKLKNWVG